MVDDEIVRQGLVCAIRHTPSESEAVAFVVSRLAATGTELNVNEEDWALALRGICTSVTNHCRGKTGSFSYLTTARAFVAKASGSRS